MLHPKKVGTIPICDKSDKVKQTNEIKVAAPLLSAIDIKGKNITADALHTQTKFAEYIVKERKADYFFTVKGNQQTLQEEIAFYFENSDRKPDHVDIAPEDHGRIEIRKIWTTCELNGYLDFPYVAQVYAIEREFIDKKTGKNLLTDVKKSKKEISNDRVAYGITSKAAEKTDAAEILAINRGHWAIENSCHYIIDWNYNEDRSRISKGFGPENITRLRRFAVGVIKSKGVRSVAQQMRKLSFRPRSVLDYLKMTKNSQCAV